MELGSDGGAAAFPQMQQRGGSRWRAGGCLVLVRAEPARTRSRRPQSVFSGSGVPLGGLAKRSRVAPWTPALSRSSLSSSQSPSSSSCSFSDHVPARRFRGVGSVEAGLRPTVLARERYHADPRPARRGNAPLRQRGRLRGRVLRSGLRRERYGPGSGERASELARIVKSASSRTRCRPRTRNGASAELCELRRCAQAWPRGR
jgi:hypothetical protein